MEFIKKRKESTARVTSKISAMYNFLIPLKSSSEVVSRETLIYSESAVIKYRLIVGIAVEYLIASWRDLERKFSLQFTIFFRMY